MGVSKFKYFESDYEEAVLELLESQNYKYVCGYDIHRENDTIIYDNDFSDYLSKYSLDVEEYRFVKSYLEDHGNSNLYRSLKDTYRRIINGFNLKRRDGSITHINFIDFDNPRNNIFSAINQYEYQENELRRPDIIIFINGIPVSIFELKNPADETVDTCDAHKQTTVRYARSIPSLMKFDFINVVSDGTNNRYGSLFAPYEYYFKWNSPDGETYSNCNGIKSLKTLISGLFNQNVLLNVLKYYIYFPDTTDDNLLILPKYYQYYGAEAMFNNIINVYSKDSNKGGTYWGATGCGKSYIMLFLAKRLSFSIPLNKPTILLVTDRTDLDNQLADTFENAKHYLVDHNSRSIINRKDLLESLDNVKSGGVYLMTIQKFSEEINLLSQRKNIIIISDEAHRTQVNLESMYKFKNNEYVKTHPYGECIRMSFPNAIYVGFTGTPIDATLKTFGNIVSKYTMKQSRDDGSTVGISRLSGPREVRLDEKVLALCDDYYSRMEKIGTNANQIEASKRAMLKIKKILEAPKRLSIIVKHFIEHYENRCQNKSTVNQKAMFVCYDREIAYKVYKLIKDLRPEWFVKRKIAPEYKECSPDKKSIPIEKVKLIATPNLKVDTQEFLDILGTDEDRKIFAREFKDDKSNFKIAILVDMWITGFDVPSLDTMYLDKPVETHNLIQTISRVNRVFKGKSEGLIVDYIGLEGAIAKAMKLYSGDLTPIQSTDVSLHIFKDFLSLIEKQFNGFDYSEFFNDKISKLRRIELVEDGGEFIMKDKEKESNFMGYTLRLKKAFDICCGDPKIDTSDLDKMQYFLAVRSYLFKLCKGDTPDEAIMSNKISELVNKAIDTTFDGKDFDFDDKEDITDLFSDDFIEKINKIKLPYTKYQALIKLVKKTIKVFGKTNKLKAGEFSERLKKIVDKYNSRNEITGEESIVEEVINGISDEVKKLYSDIKDEQKSFKKLGITYDEKAFLDILIAVAKKYDFYDKYDEKTLINIAKQIKVLVSNKSKYTDWTNRDDIKDELYSDVLVLLKRNKFPPKPCEEAYDEIMKQVENYKRHSL